MKGKLLLLAVGGVVAAFAAYRVIRRTGKDSEFLEHPETTTFKRDVKKDSESEVIVKPVVTREEETMADMEAKAARTISERHKQAGEVMKESIRKIMEDDANQGEAIPDYTHEFDNMDQALDDLLK